MIEKVFHLINKGKGKENKLQSEIDHLVEKKDYGEQMINVIDEQDKVRYCVELLLEVKTKMEEYQ